MFRPEPVTRATLPSSFPIEIPSHSLCHVRSRAVTHGHPTSDCHPERSEPALPPVIPTEAEGSRLSLPRPRSLDCARKLAPLGMTFGSRTHTPHVKLPGC